MNLRVRRSLLGLLLVLAGAAFATRFLGHDTPPSQPPLSVLDPASLAAFRDDFNQAADGTRIILLLAPT